MPTATDGEGSPFIYRVFSWPANVTFAADMQSDSSNLLSFSSLTAAAAGNYPGMSYVAEESNAPT